MISFTIIYYILGKINYSKRYHILMNNKMKYIFLNNRLKEQYKKIAKEVVINKKISQYYSNRIK